jgi:hypothetical protein
MKFFRFAFLALLLVNLVFFAWAQGLFGEAETGREPQRLAAQLVPDKLRLIQPAAPVAAAPAFATPMALAPAAAPVAPAPPPPPAPPTLACRAANDLSAAQVQTLKAVAVRQPEWQLTVAARPSEPRYEVLIAALAGKEGVDAKLKELRGLGISNVPRAVADGPGKLALVFAEFSNEAAAKELLAGLVDKGVKSARVVNRTPSGLSRAELRGPEAGLGKLSELLPGLKFEACPAP